MANPVPSPSPSLAADESSPSWQILWIPITNTLPIVVATLATGAAQAKYGVYEWNAADLFLLWDNRAAQVFCSAAFILSNIGINISANAV